MWSIEKPSKNRFVNFERMCIKRKSNRDTVNVIFLQLNGIFFAKTIDLQQFSSYTLNKGGMRVC